MCCGAFLDRKYLRYGDGNWVWDDFYEGVGDDPATEEQNNFKEALQNQGN